MILQMILQMILKLEQSKKRSQILIKDKAVNTEHCICIEIFPWVPLSDVAEAVAQSKGTPALGENLFPLYGDVVCIISFALWLTLRWLDRDGCGRCGRE